MELEKVVRKISAQCKEKYKGNFRFAFFNDANNDLQIVCIISSEDIYGIGSNIFHLAGSVIVYGIISAFVFGLIRYLLGGV